MPVHLVRADLHFERLAFRTDHRGVQRLVLVAFRARDVVVKLTGDVRPQRVHDTKRRITGGEIIDQHAQRAHVVEFGKFQPLALHLAPDRIDVFRPSGDIGLDARVRKRVDELSFGLFDPGLATTAAFVEQARDAPVDVWLQVTEREILQFPLDLPDAEPVCERRMDVGAELGQRAPLRVRRTRHRTHAHELACKQDEDHADVADDREQQAAQAFGTANSTVCRIQ